MANRIRTGRDGICSLWNFISRRTMKAFEEEEQRRYTLSLFLSLFSFHLFSLFYLCCSTCSLFSFFFLFYYLSLHPWISILLFIASVAYMHINDESSNRTADRRARRIHFRFVSTRVIIRGEKWEKHLTIVHRVETRGRLMRTRVKNDSSSSLPSFSLLFFF